VRLAGERVRGFRLRRVGTGLGGGIRALGGFSGAGGGRWAGAAGG